MKKKISKWTGTLEAWIVEAKRLRRQFESGQIDFMRHLYAGELTRSMWDVGGVPDFASLLDRETLVDTRTYAAYRKTELALGLEAVDDLGFHGAIAVGKTIPDKRLRTQDVEVAAAITLVRDYSKRHGVHISERHAATILRGKIPSLRKIRVQRTDTTIAALKKENLALRAEVKRLKARLATYQLRRTGSVSEIGRKAVAS